MDRVVLDASAVLAHIHREKGSKRVDELLDALETGAAVQVFISSVNWCEVLTCMHRDKVSDAEQMLAAILAFVDEVSFARAEAEASAGMAMDDASLSLGDRACLTLAGRLNAVAWTTDKAWARRPFGVKVELLR